MATPNSDAACTSTQRLQDRRSMPQGRPAAPHPNLAHGRARLAVITSSVILITAVPPRRRAAGALPAAPDPGHGGSHPQLPAAARGRTTPAKAQLDQQQAAIDTARTRPQAAAHRLRPEAGSTSSARELESLFADNIAFIHAVARPR
jgi:hypothetical protein